MTQTIRFVTQLVNLDTAPPAVRDSIPGPQVSESLEIRSLGLGSSAAFGSRPVAGVLIGKQGLWQESRLAPATVN